MTTTFRDAIRHFKSSAHNNNDDDDNDNHQILELLLGLYRIQFLKSSRNWVWPDICQCICL